MSKTSFKNTCVIRVIKYLSFALFLLSLAGTAVNVLLYLSPETLSKTSFIYDGFEDFISGYALYATLCSGFVTVLFFCLYRYASSKLSSKKENSRKTSPATMQELVVFAKRHTALIDEIAEQRNSYEGLKALEAKVNQYNADAEAFEEQAGVAPKFITYSDYGTKLDALKFSK